MMGRVVGGCVEERELLVNCFWGGVVEERGERVR
jgi:hypothetical protein